MKASIEKRAGRLQGIKERVGEAGETKESLSG